MGGVLGAGTGLDLGGKGTDFGGNGASFGGTWPPLGGRGVAFGGVGGGLGEAGGGGALLKIASRYSPSSEGELVGAENRKQISTSFRDFQTGMTLTLNH